MTIRTAKKKLDESPDLKKEINDILKKEGLEYLGTSEVRHLLWVLVDDVVVKFLKDRQVSCTNYQFNSEDRTELGEAMDKDWEGGIPYTVIIKPGGEIIYRHTGPIDPLEVKKAIIGYLGRYYF